MELDRFKNIANDAIAAGVVVLVALLLYLVIRRGLTVLERDRHIEHRMAARFARVLRWVILGTVLLMVVQQTGVFRNAWAVLSAVLATIAVGFVALWSVLSNMVCALMILLYKPFRQGDLVELLEPSGPSVQGGEHFRGLVGIVRDVNFMFTTLEEASDDGESTGFDLRVPNNVFFQKTIRVRRQKTVPPPSFYEDSSTGG